MLAFEFTANSVSSYLPIFLSTSPAGRLRINFDITFPSLQCSEANLDAMDVAGEQQNGIDHDMTKTR